MSISVGATTSSSANISWPGLGDALVYVSNGNDTNQAIQVPSGTNTYQINGMSSCLEVEVHRQGTIYKETVCPSGSSIKAKFNATTTTLEILPDPSDTVFTVNGVTVTGTLTGLTPCTEYEFISGGTSFTASTLCEKLYDPCESPIDCLAHPACPQCAKKLPNYCDYCDDCMNCTWCPDCVEWCNECEDCRDCENCPKCNPDRCSSCTFCDKCPDCPDCQGACSSCTNCADCPGCPSCVAMTCDVCEFCDQCEMCQGCENTCRDCTNCDDCPACSKCKDVPIGTNKIIIGVAVALFAVLFFKFFFRGAP